MGQRKSLAWVVPYAYSRSTIEKEVADYIRQLRPALLRVGLPGWGLCLCILAALSTKGLLPPGSFWKVAILIPAGLIWLTGFPVVLAWLSKFGVQKAKITRRYLRCGRMTATLGQVSWYGLIQLQEFSELRAVEIAYSVGRHRERIVEMAFDPAVTDEEEITEFMAEVLPGKLKADS